MFTPYRTPKFQWGFVPQGKLVDCLQVTSARYLHYKHFSLLYQCRWRHFKEEEIAQETGTS